MLQMGGGGGGGGGGGEAGGGGAEWEGVGGLTDFWRLYMRGSERKGSVVEKKTFSTLCHKRNASMD